MRIGLNPYGLAYTVGLQGLGTPRANPHPIGLNGFIAFAHELGARCIELDWRWLTPMTDGDLCRVRAAVADLPVIYSHWLAQQPGETLDDAIHRATAIGAAILRLHLTPVLEGARASWGARWIEMIAHARRTLERDAPKAADAGLVMAIENHQDLGSEELLDIAGQLGDHVGLVLDTGNPFAVGEDPMAFVRRAAHRIRHVHLKDYVAQFTGEGYRLIRCAVGEGCVPFAEIVPVLASHGICGTASIEIGALDARHIRLFADDWWEGYPPRAASELGAMMRRLRRNRLDDGADGRTPWERSAPGEELVQYETDQVRRSVAYARELGWTSQR